MSNNITTRLLTPCILLLLLMLAACRNPSPWDRQGWVADSLIEQHPDSVLHLLQGIDYNALDEEDQAHYGLLLTAARYKLYQPVDTTFINRSIAYYSSHLRGDKRGWGSNSSPLGGDKRGASLYYKAVVLYELGKKEEATLLLKQAEELAEQGSDALGNGRIRLPEQELLKNKIYENLGNANYDSRNYDDALIYFRKFLDSSRKLDDVEVVSLAYDCLSCTYTKLGYHDSALWIQKKNMEYIDEINDTSKVFVLSNLAGDYIKRGQYAEAKNLLNHALSIKPKANILLMLGMIAMKQGQNDSAVVNLNKAVLFNQNEFSIDAYQYLSDIYAQSKQYQKALENLKKRDSVEYLYKNSILTSRLAEIQKKYDKVSVEKRMAYRTTIFVSIITLLLVVWLLMSSYFVLKNRRLHTIIEENIRSINEGIAKKRELQAKVIRMETENKQSKEEIEELHGRIAQQDIIIEEGLQHLEDFQQQLERHRSHIGILELKKETYEHEITDLRKQIRNQQNDLFARLGHGKQVYQQIISTKQYPHFSSEDEQDFVDFFAFTYPERYYDLTRMYETLTLRYVFYLILIDEGFSNKDVCMLLNIESSSVRNYRNRMKKCLKKGSHAE